MHDARQLHDELMNKGWRRRHDHCAQAAAHTSRGASHPPTSLTVSSLAHTPIQDPHSPLLAPTLHSQSPSRYTHTHPCPSPLWTLPQPPLQPLPQISPPSSLTVSSQVHRLACKEHEPNERRDAHSDGLCVMHVHLDGGCTALTPLRLYKLALVGGRILVIALACSAAG